MVITRLLGGLGNQMFQYAFGRYLSHHLNTELFLDTQTLESRHNEINYTIREFELNVFDIKEALVYQPRKQNLLEKIKNKFSALQFVEENTPRFNSSYLQLRGNLYLTGYWQCENYFKGIEDIIRQDFTFKNHPDNYNQQILDRIKGCNAVSIHFRRGDYVSNTSASAFHGICSLDYYSEAVKYIQQQVPDITLYVFSDDIAWVKENFKTNCEMVYVDHNSGDKSYEDLRLMSSCKHNIIANSSFSWWGAWLNSNKRKIVIAPKQWFINEVNDIIPETWIAL